MFVVLCSTGMWESLLIYSGVVSLVLQTNRTCRSLSGDIQQITLPSCPQIRKHTYPEQLYWGSVVYSFSNLIYLLCPLDKIKGKKETLFLQCLKLCNIKLDIKKLQQFHLCVVKVLLFLYFGQIPLLCGRFASWKLFSKEFRRCFQVIISLSPSLPISLSLSLTQKRHRDTLHILARIHSFMNHQIRYWSNDALSEVSVITCFWPKESNLSTPESQWCAFYFFVCLFLWLRALASIWPSVVLEIIIILMIYKYIYNKSLVHLDHWFIFCSTSYLQFLVET